MELTKGKGNGTRKAYNHLMNSGVFGVADKVSLLKKPFKSKKKK